MFSTAPCSTISCPCRRCAASPCISSPTLRRCAVSSCAAAWRRPGSCRTSCGRGERAARGSPAPEPLTRAPRRAKSGPAQPFGCSDQGSLRSAMPPLKDLRYRAEYMGLRLIEALLRAVPLDFGVNLSAKAWSLIARFDHRHQRALDNLAIAFPHKTLAERQTIALAMWENLGRVMAGTMQIDRILTEPGRIEIVNQNIHRRYKDKLGSAIGVSLHMGNWELAIWPFTLAGNNPAAVYRTVKNPYVDRYVREARKVLYPGGLLGRGRDREEGQATARRIMGFVRDGGRLGLVCDLHDRSGLPVPFFGKIGRAHV